MYVYVDKVFRLVVYPNFSKRDEHDVLGSDSLSAHSCSKVRTRYFGCNKMKSFTLLSVLLATASSVVATPTLLICSDSTTANYVNTSVLQGLVYSPILSNWFPVSNRFTVGGFISRNI